MYIYNIHPECLFSISNVMVHLPCNKTNKPEEVVLDGQNRIKLTLFRLSLYTICGKRTFTQFVSS